MRCKYNQKKIDARGKGDFFSLELKDQDSPSGNERRSFFIQAAASRTYKLVIPKAATIKNLTDPPFPKGIPYCILILASFQ